MQQSQYMENYHIRTERGSLLNWKGKQGIAPTTYPPRSSIKQSIQTEDAGYPTTS